MSRILIDNFFCFRRFRFDDDEFDVPTPTNGEEGYESDSSDASSVDPAAIHCLVTLQIILASFFSQADQFREQRPSLVLVVKGHIRTLNHQYYTLKAGARNLNARNPVPFEI